MTCDAHTHFFSPGFFQFFARQVTDRRGTPFSLADLASETGLEIPTSHEELADRWVAEMDEHDIDQMVTIASVPGDPSSVLDAASRHPDRLVPFAMFHPTAAGVPNALDEAAAAGLRGVCLFPAMHHFSMDDPDVLSFVERAAGLGQIVFVHFGILKLGIRDKLGLPSPFDLRFSNPISLCKAAQAFPETAFVIPHFGAGFFREALLVGRQCANVYLDTSSSNSWIVTQPGNLSLRDVFRQTIEALGADRILYGSDSNVFPRGYVRAVLDAQRSLLPELDLSREDQDAILGGNLTRILGRGSD